MTVPSPRTRHDWAARSSPALAHEAEDLIAILPVAATEQHGPHLPLGVDTMIMEGLLDTLCEMAEDEVAFTLLPVQALGKSDEHLFAPGTLSLPAPLAIATWTEIGLAVHCAGIRRLAILSSHGGNTDVVGIVARDLRRRTGMLVAKAHWSAFGQPDSLFDQAEVDEGLHGGGIETSLMLHFRPDLVDGARARNFPNEGLARTRGRRAGYQAPLSLTWIATDLNRAGVTGDASKATAEKGARLARHWSGALLKALADLRDLPLPEPPPAGMDT